jgi:hypothetical protein
MLSEQVTSERQRRECLWDGSPLGLRVRVAFSCFLPGRVVGGLVGGKVRRGGSSAAAVAEGGPYSDDPSRDERPANYDPNGEQLDVASRHEPGIISGKGQRSHHHPHEDPKKEEDRSQDSLANSSAMSRGHRRSKKRHKLVGGRCWRCLSPPRQRIAVAVCVAKSQSVLAQPTYRKL